MGKGLYTGYEIPKAYRTSFALPGAPFEVESSCLPKTGGGAERTKKVEDRTDAKVPRWLRFDRCQKYQKVEDRQMPKVPRRLRSEQMPKVPKG